MECMQFITWLLACLPTANNHVLYIYLVINRSVYVDKD